MFFKALACDFDGTLASGDRIDHVVREALEQSRQAAPSASAVLDFAVLSHGEKVALIDRALRRIRELRDKVGRPHWVILDEAHYLLHEGGVADDALGSKDRGLCVVTYRPGWLRPAVIDPVDVCIFARTTGTDELAFLRSMMTRIEESEVVCATLPRLRRGEFLLVDRGSSPGPSALTFIAAPRQTAHVRHLNKYIDSVVPPGREFLFRYPHGPVVASANSLQSLRGVLGTVPGAVLAHHAGRGDFSRWVRDVFADLELARQLGKAEVPSRRGELADLREMIDVLITARYGGG